MPGVSRTKNPKTPKCKERTSTSLAPSPCVTEPAESSQSELSRFLVAPPSTLSSKDQFLLQHYFYTVSGLLSSTHDRSINTYCRVVLPMAMSCDMLLNTLLLVSNSHLASRYEQFSWDLPHYRSRVLPTLISRINAWDGFQPTMLATIIMLSINENYSPDKEVPQIFEANPKNWSEHLKAAGRIISDYMAQCKEPDHDTRMLLDIFAYHNVLASVGMNQASLVMGYYTKDTWSALTGHSNAFLASVDRLLSLVAKLSMLSSQSTVGAGTRYIKPSQFPAAMGLKAELENWRPPQAIPDDACNTAEAMRHAGLLFFYKLTSTSSPDDERDGILRSCGEIVRRIGHVSTDSPAAASHLWPLYMAGCFLNKGEPVDQTGQTFIRSRLSALKSKRGVKTVDRVRERLEQIWNCGDGEMVDVDAPLILL
ncbi:hypothetical protein A1O3_08791 [Capronia epimyces CBS 606.96]|uniref:Uncharacterized protein n=1 Tax=Capronia epimyces CBS 606.96 TaxID=1182542 RepID=W9YA84_9EURO|nr:uncharacterized protein A1O3_08791 [Capronia epimyces CBS 606.96]EXJ79289.1 hypothetical protein A1O3_08791 [Capronia epimyces CBS 606.96]